MPGQGISVASQRNLSNSFIVDGLSANDDAAGLSGIPYGVDAARFAPRIIATSPNGRRIRPSPKI